MPWGATSAPISWVPSSYWDGNDGSWNSFIVQVGTPPQDFRVLPSTAGQELWLPHPDGCNALSPNNTAYCGYLRGALPFDGANSSGFATNESSTWTSNGIFTLHATQEELGYGGNGLYGFDTVIWGNASTSPNLTQQVVAGVADSDWWLGQVGLGPKSINFTTFNDPIPSYLSNLVSKDIIPSHSFACTAGAAYRDKSPASLTLGGYDTNRFETPGLSIAMNADNSRPLQVGVQRILADNTLDGTVNLLPIATYHFIDSSIPHIWLPEDSITAFVSAFGLTYDNATDFYLINDTMRTRMLELNPTITFIFSSSTTSSSSDTLSIELPYAAFDLQASYPFYQNATNYFPIRKAVNDSQYTIGRTFLQEAYLIADFDRNNFTIAKTSFDNMTAENLVPIWEPAVETPVETTPAPEASQGLSGGAIAGVVIGCVAGVAILSVLLWFCVFRKRQLSKQTDTEKPDVPERTDDKKLPVIEQTSELPSQNAIHEAEGPKPAYEVDSSPRLHELYSPDMRSEMSGNTPKWGTFSDVQELHTPPIGHESGYLAEAPGSEGARIELASTPVDKQTAKQ